MQRRTGWVVFDIDNLRGEIRAHPLLAVFTVIVVGGLLGRALR